MEFLLEYGYLGLFAVSFLAATILPLSSEFILSFLLLNHYNPSLTIAIATTGNVLGSIVNYGLGFGGRYIILEKLLRLSKKNIITSEKRFEKYGIFSLFFAWVPFIGDPLTVTAGILKINFFIFLFLVTAGKFIRYIIVTIVILSF